MAKMVKAADLHTLTHDTSSIQQFVTQYLTPHVAYDQMILADNLLEYGDNASLAVALSGTSDKKSKSYKAAIRSVQMWKKGQAKPGKVYQRKLIETLSVRGMPTDKLIEAAGTLTTDTTVFITGYVKISDTPAEYRRLHATMSPDMFKEFVELAVTGDQPTALELFSHAGYYPHFDLYGSSEHPVTIEFS